MRLSPHGFAEGNACDCHIEFSMFNGLQNRSPGLLAGAPLPGRACKACAVDHVEGKPSTAI